MDPAKLEKDRQLFAQRAVILGVLLGVSVVSNAVLAVALTTNNKVVLVPTMPMELSIDANGVVDKEYLENLSRDCVYLLLNKTPETANYFVKRAQQIMDPTTFEQVKVQFEKESLKSEQEHTSQTFYPNDFYVNSSNLYAEVKGTLQITQGQQVLDNQPKIYALHFTRQGTLIRLKSIAEIDPKDSLGSKVTPAVAAGTEGTVAP